MRKQTCTSCGESKYLSPKNWHRDSKNNPPFCRKCKLCKNASKRAVKVPVEPVDYHPSQAPTKNALQGLDGLVEGLKTLSSHFGVHYSISIGTKGNTRIQSHGQVGQIYKGKTPQEAINLVSQE